MSSSSPGGGYEILGAGLPQETLQAGAARRLGRRPPAIAAA
jgi:hypothetical protein